MRGPRETVLALSLAGALVAVLAVRAARFVVPVGPRAVYELARDVVGDARRRIIRKAPISP